VRFSLLFYFREKMSRIIVCVSLYANPLHSGHISCLEAAKELGDVLVVIVNSDHQALLKKPDQPIFMNDIERLKVIRALRCVDHAMIGCDLDSTVCESLRQIQPTIFANGGDRVEGNVPEASVCEEIGCRMVFGVGNEKTQSSSALIANIMKSNI
jgi:D-beta-D-heptose 7-phosphate kinase/D-beta-D-heptose 1-phosphate adenosyltransferase